MMKKLIVILTCIIIALTVVSCKKNEEPVPDIEPENEAVVPEPQPEPEPEPVPSDLYAQNKLTGVYDLDKELAGSRPVAIMVNNNTHGLPQRGIADCDMLIEIEVEGGITRLMAFFADYKRIDQVGTVRSLRNQFLDIARPLDAIIIHVGGSRYADAAVQRYGYKTLDAMGCSIVVQDKSRLGKYGSEHTWFTNPELIENCIKTRKMRIEDESADPVFNFVEYGSEAVLDDGIANSAEWAFSNSYDSKIQYDKDSKMYKFWQHGDQRYDELSGDPICYSNIFLIIASRPGYYGEGIPQYDYSAGGTGYYLCEGKYEKFTWTKSSPESRMTLKNLDGSDLKVNPGRSYIAIINTSHADTIKLISDAT